LLQFKEQFIRLISFAAQQSAEKSIKAYLAHKKLRFPNTHNIDDLLKILRVVDSDFAWSLEDSAALSDYAIAYRYPDAAKEELTFEKVEELVGIAEKTLERILLKISEIVNY
jgi:HEPN domain-containing protein